MNKTAVTLAGLKAANAAMKGKVVRRYLTRSRLSGAPSFDNAPSMLSSVGSAIPKSLKDVPALRAFRGKVIVRGDSAKAAKAHIGELPGKGRELFNRMVRQHEATELAAGTRGTLVQRHKFGSHLGVRPPMNDLNIAATLRGEGSTEAGNAIRALRAADVERLRFYMPDLGRFPFGEQRLSRHAIRRLEQARWRALGM